MSMKKDLDQLIKELRKQGWTIEPTKKCHYKWTAPSGKFFFTSSTPSDTRAFHRIKSDIRKASVTND